MASRALGNRPGDLDMEGIIATYEKPWPPEQPGQYEYKTGLLFCLTDGLKVRWNEFDGAKMVRLVRFIIEIGSEGVIVEPDSRLRQLARKILGKHIVGKECWLRPVHVSKDQNDHPLGLQAINLMIAFFADDPRHSADLPSDSLQGVKESLASSWRTKQSGRGDGLAPIVTIERALFLVGDYEFMVQNGLYRWIPEFFKAVSPRLPPFKWDWLQVNIDVHGYPTPVVQRYLANLLKTELDKIDADCLMVLSVGWPIKSDSGAADCNHGLQMRQIQALIQLLARFRRLLDECRAKHAQ